MDKKSPEKGARKLFEDWLNIRNKFAHGMQIGENILYSGEAFNIQELADKHSKLQLKINAFLEKYSVLRGPYFSQMPLKETEK